MLPVAVDAMGGDDAPGPIVAGAHAAVALGIPTVLVGPPGLPGRSVAGKVTRKQVQSIAEEKMKDLNAESVEAAMRMVEGSARSMGLDVVG